MTKRMMLLAAALPLCLAACGNETGAAADADVADGMETPMTQTAEPTPEATVPAADMASDAMAPADDPMAGMDDTERGNNGDRRPAE